MLGCTGSVHQEHVAPMLRALHWLPAMSAVRFKMLVLPYKVLNSLGILRSIFKENQPILYNHPGKVPLSFALL